MTTGRINQVTTVGRARTAARIHRGRRTERLPAAAVKPPPARTQSLRLFKHTTILAQLHQGKRASERVIVKWKRWLYCKPTDGQQGFGCVRSSKGARHKSLSQSASSYCRSVCSPGRVNRTSKAQSWKGLACALSGCTALNASCLSTRHTSCEDRHLLQIFFAIDYCLKR